MLSLLRSATTRSWYWWLLLLAGISFESVALYYQYVLEYGPCPLCIHTRIGIMGFMLVATSALLINSPIWWRVSHLFNTIIMGWLSERAYLLLGTERGFTFHDCGVDPGLPAWFALDQWFPIVFEVKESCGYTPIVAFGISMAEALMIVFPLMLLASLVLFVFSFFSAPKER